MAISQISRLVRSAGFVASALTVSAAFAQQAAPAPDSSAAGESPALEEIVVTAQKRSEDIQHVPIAMSAISAETL
jgi:iron complex outermembrane recepter protein